MAILLHVIIALASLAYTAYLFFKPGRTKLRVSYGLITLTIASGVYLVASTGTHILQACITGLFYLCLAGSGVFAARYKLAGEHRRTGWS